jgi:hypothetical protein
MNLSELVDGVVSKTKRPDKADSILLAVQEATIFAHTYDFFRRDMVEIPVEYATPSFKGRLDYGNVLPGFRKIAYWRKFEPITCLVGDYLLPVEADQLIDQFHNAKVDKYYLAGKVLNWISSTSDKAHLIGYYKYPGIKKSDYDSWIAEDHPFVLINYASGIIFGQIGQQDEKVSHQNLAIAQLALVLTSDIESNAR